MEITISNDPVANILKYMTTRHPRVFFVRLEFRYTLPWSLPSNKCSFTKQQQDQISQKCLDGINAILHGLYQNDLDPQIVWQQVMDGNRYIVYDVCIFMNGKNAPSVPEIKDLAWKLWSPGLDPADADRYTVNDRTNPFGLYFADGIVIEEATHDYQSAIDMSYQVASSFKTWFRMGSGPGTNYGFSVPPLHSLRRENR